MIDDDFDERASLVAAIHEAQALLEIADTDGGRLIRQQAEADKHAAIAALCNPETNDPADIGMYRAFVGRAETVLAMLSPERLELRLQAGRERLTEYDQITEGL